VDIELPEDMLLREAHNIGKTLQNKLEALPEVERAGPMPVVSVCRRSPSPRFSRSVGGALPFLLLHRLCSVPALASFGD